MGNLLVAPQICINNKRRNCYDVTNTKMGYGEPNKSKIVLAKFYFKILTFFSRRMITYIEDELSKKIEAAHFIIPDHSEIFSRIFKVRGSTLMTYRYNLQAFLNHLKKNKVIKRAEMIFLVAKSFRKSLKIGQFENFLHFCISEKKFKISTIKNIISAYAYVWFIGYGIPLAHCWDSHTWMTAREKLYGHFIEGADEIPTEFLDKMAEILPEFGKLSRNNEIFEKLFIFAILTIARPQDPWLLLWTNFLLVENDVIVLYPEFKTVQTKKPLHKIKLEHIPGSPADPKKLFLDLKKISSSDIYVFSSAPKKSSCILFSDRWSPQRFNSKFKEFLIFCKKRYPKFALLDEFNIWASSFRATGMLLARKWGIDITSIRKMSKHSKNSQILEKMYLSKNQLQNSKKWKPFTRNLGGIFRNP